MTQIDRYVGRIVAGAFLAGVLFFLFLMVVMDLLGNFTRYVDRAARQGVSGLDLWLRFGSYYARMLPLLFTTVAPFVTVIACMFSMARLQGANEVVPMLFVGRSMQRVLRPMLLCGVMSGLLMVACWQWILPPLGAAIVESESFFQGSTIHKHLVDESPLPQRHQLYVREFDAATRRIVGVRQLIEYDLVADNMMIVAASGEWDDSKSDWRLTQGQRRTKEGSVPVEWLGRPDLPPGVLLQRGREAIDPETLSYTAIIETMALRPNRSDLRLALHRHIAYPLANLILLLLALPLAINFERGARIGRLLMAIGLCAAYVFFDLTCQSLGQRGLLHPIVAAWSPTIFFGSLGVVMFGSART